MSTQNRIRGRVVGSGLAVFVLLFGGCARQETRVTTHEHPAEVEHIEGTDLSRVTLTEKAIERVDVRTTLVIEDEGTGRKIVPYASIIYDVNGNTWVYTGPEPRTFVRAPIVVDRVEGDNVYLTDGPPVGTAVASTGVAELYGTEFTVGH